MDLRYVSTDLRGERTASFLMKRPEEESLEVGGGFGIWESMALNCMQPPFRMEMDYLLSSQVLPAIY